MTLLPFLYDYSNASLFLPIFIGLNMKIFFDRKRFLFYTWAGLVYLSFWEIDFFNHYPETFYERTFNNLWRFPYVLVVTYIFLEYSWPYIRRNWKKVLLPLLLLAAHILAWSLGLYVWRMLGIQLHIFTPLMAVFSLDEAVSNQVVFSFGALFILSLAGHIDNYRRLVHVAQQLRIEKQEAELNYLKSQTNPHFLFNTLNNIYSLARQKSHLAPESILRLSKILRFMLYETGGEFISIGQEVKIISDYIALEQLRYDESLRISFIHDVDDMQQAVPPLLLIPLVENAFKHGASETLDKPFVEILLSVKQRKLRFEVRNSAGLEAGLVKENIGLTNLRRQLELLYRDYELTVEHSGIIFKAIIKVDLASHV